MKTKKSPTIKRNNSKYFFSYKPFHKKTPSSKVNQIYNTISNIYNSSEINSSLEKLTSLKERILLVDTIIGRREEIKKAQEQEKLSKLTPLISKLKSKYNNLRNNKKIDESNNKHYRRFSLNSNLISTKSPKHSEAIRMSNFLPLPEINENEVIKRGFLNKIPSKTVILSNENNFKEELETNPISVERNKQKRISLLKVVTKFNDLEIKKGEDSKNNNITQANSQYYDNNFHLIPVETPRKKEQKFKRYMISTHSMIDNELLEKSKKKTSFGLSQSGIVS